LFLLQFERFLPPDAATVASVYAPIMFPPAGVLMFKQTADGKLQQQRMPIWSNLAVTLQHCHFLAERT